MYKVLSSVLCWLFVVQVVMFGHTVTDFNLPPTGTNLLTHEQTCKENKVAKKVSTVVQKALRAKSCARKKRRVKRKKTICCTDLPKKTGLIEQQKNPLQRFINTLLDRQFTDPELTQKNVTFHFKNCSIRDAIKTLSKLSGLMCVIDADVTGEVINMNLKDVSVASAFHILLSNNLPRLCLVKHLDVWRVVRKPVAVELVQSRAFDLEQGQYFQGVETMHHTKWDENLKKRLELLWQGMLGAEKNKAGVYLMFDDATKKVVFRAKRNHVQDFRNCLHEIDKSVPRVKIDARVVVASKDFEENFGVQWSGVYNRRASVNSFGLIGLGPITTPENTESHNFFKDLITWSLNLLPTGMTTKTGLNIPIVFGNKDMSTKRLNLLLNAAEMRNEIRTILKPALLVNSEECAEILVGQQLPQETRVDEAIEGKLTNVTTTHYKDIGMKIRVRPVVKPEQSQVFLDIFVENSSVVRQNLLDKFDSSQSLRGLFNYTIETARSQSRVLLKSGQATLIGGLITKMQDRVQTGVPLLQDIPILGWLFKGRQKRLVDKQILIFITPTVV